MICVSYNFVLYPIATDADEEREDSPKPEKGNDKDKTSAALKKKKRKIRLDMHLDQIFVDSSDAYVWLYDPIGWFYWAGGTAIVIGTIAICLFPLWPPMMRTGVHYLSMGAAGFLLSIMGIGVIKYIMFALLFALSAGKLSFWLFPNLTEDVGFLESFMPLYDYTYTGMFDFKWSTHVHSLYLNKNYVRPSNILQFKFLGKSLLGRKKKKAKDSDDEESDDEEDEEEDENADNEESDAASAEKDKKTNADNDESDDSTSKASSKTGKDFEMVDKSTVDTADEEPDQPENI